MTTELCSIMKKHGSDKGLGWHNYTEKYNQLFDKIKNNKLNIFELGLGTNNTDVPSNMGKNGIPGASLRGWKEYFPNADICGADIDSRILFQEERIRTFYVDQTNKNTIQHMWNAVGDISFDLILDDGLHELGGNICFLENSFHKLNTTGTYIIEDVVISHIRAYESSLKSLQLKFGFKFEIVKMPHLTNTYDNCLVIINKNNK